MPTIVCPICGSIIDGHADDESAWHAKFFPGVDGNTEVPWECSDCQAELAVGDIVFHRRSGTVGKIAAIIRSAAGNKVFQIQWDHGSIQVCIRSQITLGRPQESPGGGVDHPPKNGYF